MFSQKKISLLPRKSRFAKGIFNLALAAQMVFIPVLSSVEISAATNPLVSPAVTIYNNGPLATGATTKSGVAAPTGAQWSEAQNNTGDTTVANTNAGFSCGVNNVARCADNFVVPVGETWTINQVAVYGYQTGAVATTSPFTGGTLQIWNGRPGDAGSAVVFGDATTNRLATSTNTNLYRIFNTVAPPPGSAPGTTRIIWQNNLTVGPALVLTAGNYWIDFQLTASGSGANFTPSVTIVNTRYTPIQNARQQLSGVWSDATDAGAGTTPPTLPQDLPFILDGTKTTTRVAPPISRAVDFNADNKSDYALARATNLTAATTWYILNNGGTATATQFGTGVGFAGGDVAVPADYDGDGKSDIAIWRPAAPNSIFYILQSQTNTVRTAVFGLSGDDPTITGDYDGDGKADPAVYRNNSTAGGQNFFYYLRSAGPANSFAAFAFGLSGDRAYPGDFDGDGKFDPAVYRNNGGNAQHFQLRSTQGYTGAYFGLFTDKFVTADFDGDYKSDLVAVRTSGSNYVWYVATSTSNQFLSLAYGSPTTDYITPGDYDGDNRTDFALFRSGASGVGFYQIGSLSAPLVTQFGASTGNLTAPDYPVAAYQVH